tara:strand:+ start:212 stop:538 length:327 start_codon:yes stop_codon:yes gene_type:complete
MLIKLYENRRTLTIQEITDEIRQNVSIYGIFNGYWKQKEMLIKIEGIKRRMQHEVEKSNETIDKVKSKIKQSNKALLQSRITNKVKEKQIALLEKELEERKNAPTVRY